MLSELELPIRQTAKSDYLARTIKLSKCYLSFYFFQMVCAMTLCCLLFFDNLQYVAFMEIPLAFFILFDIIVNHYVQYEQSVMSRIQIINMLVLVGSLVTIVLDLTMPETTQNRADTISSIMIAIRYVMQTIWIIKLGMESKKLIQTKQNQMIKIPSNNEVEQEFSKMTL